MTKAIGLRPCTFIYILLMLLTLVTWAVGVSELTGLAFAYLVLGLSLFKAFLIGDYYMGLRTVSSTWRWIVVGWLVIPGTLISIAFYSAAN